MAYPGNAYPGDPYPGNPGNPGYPASAYANWGQRVGAYLLDGLPAWVLIGIGSLFASHSFLIYLLFVLAALAWLVYNRWIQMGNTGQSLGKRTLGIRLVKETTGEPIGAGMAFVRDICHFVDSIICYIGWLFPLWDAKRQTLADKIVGTVVVPA
ncbi:MAG TPA: RDD family protein [Streptosporangiaceae bacterium]|nr:RDD family protein [Streptosporangiaceae bacterium]